MPVDLGERVARVEEKLDAHSRSLSRIENNQETFDTKLDKVSDGLACFKGAWGVANGIFMALVSIVLAAFGKRLGS